MADFEQPSFSLGPDFDLYDFTPHINPTSKNDKAPSASNHSSVAETILVTVIDSDSGHQDSLSKLKRLRRGSKVLLKTLAMDQSRGQLDLVQRTVRLIEQRKSNESIKTPTKKSFRIPTPALDDVCEEYFSSIKDKRKCQSNVGQYNRNIHATNNVIHLGDPRPPAHQYFFHSDPRVQDLVLSRLPNFFPINAENKDSSQPSTSNIDYIGQFSCIENSKQTAKTNKTETSSRKNSNKSKTQETSQSSANPKLNTEKRVPKDAGKRRVQADGQSASVGVGHWFTNKDEKRVYVSKNGQELTGRAAYILYKKESAAGFKNKKVKKTSTKKK